MLKEIWTVTMLFIAGIMDLRKKSIPVVFLVGAVIVSAAVSLLYTEDRTGILPGLIPGGALLLLGKLSGCVGGADGIMLLILGAMYGLKEGGELMMYALMLAAIVSFFMIALRHAGRKDTIPFIPFLLAGFFLFQLRMYMTGGG